jgi:hypothetical protein
MKLFRRTKNLTPATETPTEDDALVPIEGVSMALFAELCARMARVEDDPDTFARIAARQGVSRPAWEAARAGWTARLENPATARHIVVPYMAIYQAALAQYGGPAASATYEQYIEMSAMINTSTKEPHKRPNELEPMYAAFGITVIDWSQISSYWVDRIRADTQLAADFARRMKARMDELDAEFLASLPVRTVEVA